MSMHGLVVTRRRRFGSRIAALGVIAACTPQHAPPEPRLPEFSLAVRLQPVERTLEVSGTVRIPAADRPRQELRLAMGVRMSELQVDVVEPAVSAGPVALERVGQPTERVEGERGNAKWVARPRHAIPAGQSVTLRFSAHGSGETSFLYHVGPEVAFATGWGDAWYPIVEGAGGLGTGELTVQVPPAWKVITGAARRSSAAEEARGTFRFAQLLPTYFTFVAGPYSIVRHPGAPRLTAWLLMPRNHIQSLLGGASAMLDTLASEFGPYAFGELALVDVPRSITKAAGFNAFSPVGFLVLNSRALDAPDAKYELEWLGHEMSHQWFPHVVTWDPPGFLYLEEALAEYGGMRLVETIAGPEAAQRQRTTGYEYDPIYSASAYFRLVGAGVDEPLAGLRDGINQRNLAYNKGSLVFDMLSRELGRDRFRQIMHDVTRGRRLQTITWQAFRHVIQARSGDNLDWFFDQWLTRSGAPDFQLTWKQEDGRVRGAITQPAPYFRAHLKIEARGKQGERERKVVEANGASTPFDFAAAFAVENVVLDPDYEVLRWTPEFHALADSVRAAKRARP